jgi:hypothetical protein
MSDESNNTCNNRADAAAPEVTASEAAKSDYEIGHGRPPRETRFKPGQSGNPKGRRKSETIDDLRILTERILDEPIKVRDGRGCRTMTRLESIFHAHKMNALRGNPKAIRTLLKLARKTGMFSQAKRESLMVITEPTGDRAKILRMFHREQDALQGSTGEAIVETRNKPPIAKKH